MITISGAKGWVPQRGFCNHQSAWSHAYLFCLKGGWIQRVGWWCIKKAVCEYQSAVHVHRRTCTDARAPTHVHRRTCTDARAQADGQTIARKQGSLAPPTVRLPECSQFLTVCHTFFFSHFARTVPGEIAFFIFLEFVAVQRVRKSCRNFSAVHFLTQEFVLFLRLGSGCLLREPPRHWKWPSHCAQLSVHKPS